jgi:DNA-binding protein HU-beta
VYRIKWQPRRQSLYDTERFQSKKSQPIKAFIAWAIQESTKVSGAAATRAVAELMHAIRRELKCTGKFTLSSFGTFTVRKIKAGKALDQRTGEAIRVKARKTVRFKASPNLKQAV